MNVYAFHEHAVLLITPEVAQAILMADAGDNRRIDELTEDERRDYSSVDDAYEILESDIGVSDCVGYCSEFDGEAKNVYDQEVLGNGPREIQFAEEYIAYIMPSRTAGLFKQAYPNFDALVDEFKGKLAAYFPDDFPIRDHIYEVTGTYFC